MGDRVTKTFVLTYDECPLSLNAGGTGSRRHWSRGYREKRRWEGVWAMLLLQARVPRNIFHVTVDADLEFADNRRRDSENYRPAISKPLADALVKGQWLADDTDDFFTFAACKLLSGVPDLAPLTKQRTTLRLEAQYK